jgi:adenosyl cobinamide kinase/adenosyl cobinamide phosphate guanylyltransferase
MALTLLIGGARSGKSALAVRMAMSTGRPVVVLVTGQATDEEMAERIRRHRAGRPDEWPTIEAPTELAAAIESCPPASTLIVDCLTLWVANLLATGCTDRDVEERAVRGARLAGSRPGSTFAVSNEVGSGIVPVNDLARRYRDVLGRTNQLWAQAADRALLAIAGRVLPLDDPAKIIDGR